MSKVFTRLCQANGFIISLILILFASHAYADVSPEQYGAKADGVTDDTAAIQRAIDAGSTVYLSPKKSYYISSGLRLSSNRTIYSDGTSRLIMGQRNGAFSNTDSTLSTAIQNVAIWGRNVSRITLKGFSIIKAWNSQHVVTGVVIRLGDHIEIANLNMSGFSKATGVIKLDSIYYGRIHDNIIHDCQTADGYQLTGISIDADRVADLSGQVVSSSDFIIQKNQISRLKVDSAMAAAQKYETDGINVASTSSDNFYIMNNIITHVGEGVDVFGQRMRVDNNYIYEPYTAGVKFVHGASNGRAAYNQIYRPGLYGIVLAGSNSVSQNTSGNSIAHNSIYDAGRNPNASWNNHTRMGIGLTLNGSKGFPTKNLIYDNLIDGVINLHAGIACEYPGNSIMNNTIIGQALVQQIKGCP